jgi:hypothetical protein
LRQQFGCVGREFVEFVRATFARLQTFSRYQSAFLEGQEVRTHCIPGQTKLGRESSDGRFAPPQKREQFGPPGASGGRRQGRSGELGTDEHTKPLAKISKILFDYLSAEPTVPLHSTF